MTLLGQSGAADLFGPRRPLFWIAIAFSSFQLVTAAYSPLASQIVRAVHVGFLMLMVFGLAAEMAGRGRWSGARVMF